jgi:hypothetical protein
MTISLALAILLGSGNGIRHNPQARCQPEPAIVDVLPSKSEPIEPETLEVGNGPMEIIGGGAEDEPVHPEWNDGVYRTKASSKPKLSERDIR